MTAYPHRLVTSDATLGILREHGNLARAVAPAPYGGSIGAYAGVPVVLDDEQPLGAVSLEYTDGTVQVLHLDEPEQYVTRPPLLAECPYPQHTIRAAAWELRQLVRDLVDELAQPTMYALMFARCLVRKRPPTLTSKTPPTPNEQTPPPRQETTA